MKNRTKYAFWSYDLYPYVLWGELIRVNESGRVEVKGYEGYYTFTPLFILNKTQGEALISRLESLKESMASVKRVYNSHVYDIIEKYKEGWKK